MAKKKAPAKQGKRVRAGETWTINDNRTRGHKSTITKVKGEEIRHIPRTHDSKVRRYGYKNYKLIENPQKGDDKDCYVIPEVQVSKRASVGKKQVNQDIKNPIDKSILRHIKNKSRKK